mmetsp:Transcript_51125/g.158381  ORF Transcript_51125/g.158381 Transcript_51125/m.158381 type:complete len:154 (-) Transcript_51125:45-506(-)
MPCDAAPDPLKASASVPIHDDFVAYDFNSDMVDVGTQCDVRAVTYQATQTTSADRMQEPDNAMADNELHNRLLETVTDASGNVMDVESQMKKQLVGDNTVTDVSGYVIDVKRQRNMDATSSRVPRRKSLKSSGPRTDGNYQEPHVSLMGQLHL